MTRTRYSPTRRTALKGITGLLTTGGLVGTLTTTVGAHFPAELDVVVAPFDGDRPRSHPARGLVRVAVTNVDDVDATADPTRYRFGAPEVVGDGGGAEAVRACRVHDVDGDGVDDLVLWFRLRETGFSDESTAGELRWDRDESGEHGLSGTVEVSFRQTPPADSGVQDGC
ncbi:hypothetical protein [Halogranum rubrum]|uniref:Uncharacterized protein n=1 Tax=Halogranum salarium B-1 TaxID=1210908 RepID=J3EX84_9EURY|nr:hypothetical protein [Halogranum salarium]EJN59657.1 hypothetical protein HSB1_18150 [Halogranum salarium B-1]